MHATDRSFAPIVLTGRVRRTYIFPAPIEAAFDFFCNLPRDFSFLPHIRLVRKLQSNCFRLKYETIELGLYRVKIFCDVQVHVHLKDFMLVFKPCDSEIPVAVEAGVHSLTAMGKYHSVSRFETLKEQTVIHYQLELTAILPAPLGLAMVPGRARNRIADAIARYRIQEIADTFIASSISAFLEAQKFQS